MISEPYEHYVHQREAGKGFVSVTCLPCQRRAIVALKEIPVNEKRVVIACSDCKTPILAYGMYKGS